MARVCQPNRAYLHRHLGLIALALATVACGRGEQVIIATAHEPGSVEKVKKRIGMAGGVVALGPEEQLEIPPGSLGREVEIEFSRRGHHYSLEPDGLVFSRPARLTVPTRGLVQPAIYTRHTGQGWRSLRTLAVSSISIVAELHHFSDVETDEHEPAPLGPFGAHALLNRVELNLSEPLGQYLAASPDRIDLIVKAGPALHAELTGLDAGSTYYLTVTAYSSRRELVASAEGTLSFELEPRSRPTHAWIETAPATLAYGSGADCVANLGGSFDAATKTCHVGGIGHPAVEDSVAITGDDLGLDCHGGSILPHTPPDPALPGPAVLTVLGRGVRVSSCSIKQKPGAQATLGIVASGAEGLRLTNVEVNADVETGVRVLLSDGAVLDEVRVSGDEGVAKDQGIEISESVGPTVIAARTHTAAIGIHLLDNHGGRISESLLDGTRGVTRRLVKLGLVAGRDPPQVRHNDFLRGTSPSFVSFAAGYLGAGGRIDEANPVAMSLDDGSEGNFWSRELPPLFVPGPPDGTTLVDSNAPVVVDRHPYCRAHGWDQGLVPGVCPGQQGQPPSVSMTVTPQSVPHGSVFSFALAASDDVMVKQLYLDLHCDGTIDAGPVDVGAVQGQTTFALQLDTAGDVQACGMARDDQGNESKAQLVVGVTRTPPVLTSLSPQSKSYDSSVLLNIAGNGFLAGSAGELYVRIGQAYGTATVFGPYPPVRDDVQSVYLQAGSLVPGSHKVWIDTPLPNGGISNPLDFMVTAPAPVLDGMTPERFMKGCGPETEHPACTGVATLRGDRFFPGLWLEVYHNFGGQPGAQAAVVPATVEPGVESEAVATIPVGTLSSGLYWVRACQYSGGCSDDVLVRIFEPDDLEVVSLERKTLLYGDAEQPIRGSGNAIMPGATLTLEKDGIVRGGWGAEVDGAAFTFWVRPFDRLGYLGEGVYTANLSNSQLGLPHVVHFEVVIGRPGEHDFEHAGFGTLEHGRGPVLMLEPGNQGRSGRLVVYRGNPGLCSAVVKRIQDALPEDEASYSFTTNPVSVAEVYIGGPFQNIAETGYRATRIDIALLGLQSDAFYHYRVVCWKLGTFQDVERFWPARDVWFRTPPATGHDIRFAVMGDLKQDGGYFNPVDEDAHRDPIGTVAAQRAVSRKLTELRDNGYIDFVLVAGDVSNNAGWYDDYYDHYLKHWHDMMLATPFYPVLGNHDLHAQTIGDFRELVGPLDGSAFSAGLSGWLVSYPEAALPYLMLVPSPAHDIAYNRTSSIERDRRPFVNNPEKLHYKTTEFYSVRWGDVLILGLGVPMPADDDQTQIGRYIDWGFGRYIPPSFGGGNALGQWLEDTLNDNHDAKWKMVLAHAHPQLAVPSCTEFEGEPFVDQSLLTQRLFEAGADFFAVGHSSYGIFGQWGTDDGCGHYGSGFVGDEANHLSMTDLYTQVVPAIQHAVVGAATLVERPGFALGRTRGDVALLVGYRTQETAENLCGYTSVLPCDDMFEIPECGGVFPPKRECAAIEGGLACVPILDDPANAVQCHGYNTCASTLTNLYARTVVEAENGFDCENLP